MDRQIQVKTSIMFKRAVIVALSGSSFNISNCKIEMNVAYQESVFIYA